MTEEYGTRDTSWKTSNFHISLLRFSTRSAFKLQKKKKNSSFIFIERKMYLIGKNFVAMFTRWENI